jgi:signal transduction histidine kinase
LAARPGRVAGALLALAAFGQAAGQAVSFGFARAGEGQDPGLLAFLYAFPLCALALLSTVPLLFLRPVGAAVLSVLANVIVLAVFPAPTVAGALVAVFAVWRLGADGELRSSGALVSAQYLAVGLGLPFLVLAVARHGNLACVLLASAVPAAAGAGIALRAGRTARTYSEAGEALADTLVAHTARGERARIARELHDVVAHHISMIAVQAETGRLTTPGLPEAGARRFAEIGDTARAGLTEMRRLLGVLREDAADAAESAAEAGAVAGTGPASGTGGAVGTGSAAGTGGAIGTGMAAGAGGDTRAHAAGTLPAAAGRTDTGARTVTGARAAAVSRQPQPGLDQVAELVDAVREASGAGTRLIISGPVTPLDPGVELAAYRIVQEALTNTRRHAPGAAVDVELRYGPDALRLRVRDNGPGPGGDVAKPRGDGGHGLLGMRERAFSVGGALYTGAAPGGGFLVEAVLPAEPDPVRQPRASASASVSVSTSASASVKGSR